MFEDCEKRKRRRLSQGFEGFASFLTFAAKKRFVLKNCCGTNNLALCWIVVKKKKTPQLPLLRKVVKRTRMCSRRQRRRARPVRIPRPWLWHLEHLPLVCDDRRRRRISALFRSSMSTLLSRDWSLSSSSSSSSSCPFPVALFTAFLKGWLLHRPSGDWFSDVANLLLRGAMPFKLVAYRCGSIARLFGNRTLSRSGLNVSLCMWSWYEDRKVVDESFGGHWTQQRFTGMRQRNRNSLKKKMTSSLLQSLTKKTKKKVDEVIRNSIDNLLWFHRFWISRAKIVGDCLWHHQSHCSRHLLPQCTTSHEEDGQIQVLMMPLLATLLHFSFVPECSEKRQLYLWVFLRF